MIDEQGRMRAAYAEKLQLKPDGQKRGWHSRNTPGKEGTDDAGHLIADLFDGSGGLDNLVSQRSALNQGEWRQMEAEWAQALRENKNVEVLVEVHYAEGVRPTGFTVRSVVSRIEEIDGEANLVQEEILREFDN